MTENLLALLSFVLPVLAWAAGFLLLWLWLRHDLTPKKFLSIWETDGTLSSRQILAWVVAVFGMSMRAAGRLDNAGMEICFECSFILFGIGGAVKLADKIKLPGTEVTAKKAEIKAEGDINLKTEPAAPPARPEHAIE